MDALLLSAKTGLLYLAVLVIVRLAGKRSFRNMTPFDLVVIIMIGEVTAIALERGGSLWQGLVPAATLGLLEIAVGWLNLRSRRLERLTEGRPTVVIRRGQLDLAAMRRERLTVDDLRALLHDRGVFDWSKVERAALEQTGELTVLLHEEERPVSRRDLERLLDRRLEAWEQRLLGHLGAGGAAPPPRAAGSRQRRRGLAQPSAAKKRS